jgi:hypothetical protein
MASAAIKVAYIRLFFSLQNFITSQNLSPLGISVKTEQILGYSLLCNVIFV